MIKIVKGIYGYRGSNGFIEPKSIKSAPFCLTKEKEEELVRKGIAEYVMESPVETLRGDEDSQENNDIQEGIDIYEMDYNALKSYSKKIGLPAKGSKEELLKRIIEQLDIPPNLTAEIPQ